MTESRSIETPVWVHAASGRLFGILHRPSDVEDRSIFLLMLNSGMQNRSGPQRLYVNAARKFAAAGISVLRLDLTGVGDSITENAETHFDGHKPDDVDAAIHYIMTTHNPRVLLLQGLCAGSRVAIKTAAHNPRVDGILAWSTTIYTAAQNMPQSPEEPKDRLSEAVVRKNRQRMRDFVVQLKIFRAAWWKKRLLGDKKLKNEFSEFGLTLLKILRISSGTGAKTPFFSAIDSYLDSGRKIIFVYGDHDRMPLQEFRDRCPQIGPDLKATHSYTLVKNGSHTFGSIASQQTAIAVSLEWISQHFATPNSMTDEAGDPVLQSA